MTSTLICIIVLLNYLSVLVELLLLPVPSVASTYQLLFYKDISVDKGSDGLLAKVRQWPLFQKISFLIIPVIINIIVYLIPLCIIVWPIIFKALVPVFNATTVIIPCLGILFMILGRMITIKSTLTIRQDNAQVEQSFKLHKEGIFQHSRNPGLLGMYLNILGLWLIFPTIFFLAGIFFYLLYMHFKILLEEDFLLNKFGSEYHEYLNTIPRYC